MSTFVLRKSLPQRLGRFRKICCRGPELQPDQQRYRRSNLFTRTRFSSIPQLYLFSRIRPIVLIDTLPRQCLEHCKSEHMFWGLHIQTRRCSFFRNRHAELAINRPCGRKLSQQLDQCDSKLIHNERNTSDRKILPTSTIHWGPLGVDYLPLIPHLAESRHPCHHYVAEP